MADLASLGWTATDFLRFREDSQWEQKAAGLNFLVQSSSSSLDVIHNQQQMILSSNFFFRLPIDIILLELQTSRMSQIGSAQSIGGRLMVHQVAPLTS
jgi:hypothetical protein